MRKLLFLLILFASCNPVKRVLRDPIKFEQVAQEVVRKGYCVNDTVTTEIVRDSIIRKDSLIKEFIPVPCKDFDTTFGKTRISVRSGVLKYEHTCEKEQVIRERKVTNSVRDKKLEDILKGDIAKRDGVVSELRNTVKTKDEQISSLKKENIKLKATIGGALLVLIGVFLYSVRSRLSIFGK